MLVTGWTASQSDGYMGVESDFTLEISTASQYSCVAQLNSLCRIRQFTQNTKRHVIITQIVVEERKAFFEKKKKKKKR